MKKLGWVILLAAMCTVFACAALAEGTAGIQYRYDETSGTAYVTGYSGTDEAVVIPEQVMNTASYQMFSVVGIDEYALIGGTLKYVVIPSTVHSIGDLAFFNCEQLVSVDMTDAQLTSIGTDVFGGCTSLTNVSLSTLMTELGDRMFNGCTSLASITIPAKVNAIGDDCFASCSSLTEVILMNSAVQIGANAFESVSGDFKLKLNEYGVDGVPSYNPFEPIPDDMSAAEVYAAQNGIYVAYLKGVPGAIGDNVPLPQEIKIGDTVDLAQTIGNGVNITSITSSNTSVLSVDANAKTITGAAQGTSTLTVTYTGGSSSAQVVVYQPVTSFELTPNPLVMFAGTTMPLQVANVQPSGGYGKYTWTIDSSSVGIVAISAANDTLCSLAGIKEGSATITCTNVSGATATCRVIVRPAETANSKLTLPAALTEIEEEAFYGAPAKTVELGANVSSVGARAFAYCESLVDVIIRNGNCVISDNAFEGCVNITIFCPAGSAVASWAQARTIECLPLSLLDGN